MAANATMNSTGSTHIMPTIDPSTSRTDPNSLKNPPATKDFMSCASEENLFKTSPDLKTEYSFIGRHAV